MTSQESADSNQEILLERYEVQQELGKKAGRRTVLARDLQTQELVVVKILSFGNEFEWNDLKLFEREAETLKALSHPAIPRYLDYFELDSPNSRGFALVQSYIPAQSLEAQLKAGRNFSEEEVKELAKAILEILKYLHGRQPPVIHRDIKPSNTLLTNRSGNSVGEVYLVDFGSVQTIARRSSTMTVVGSYGYMPPEQFNGKATRASDLYSLGATLIYLVTGQHPGDLPQTDLRIEFEQIANISFSFKSWLRRMTEPIASQRLASAESALQALEQPGNATQTQTRATNSKVVKPFGSQVVLKKNDDMLQIILPGVGLSSLAFTMNLSISWINLLLGTTSLDIITFKSSNLLVYSGVGIFFGCFITAFIRSVLCLFGERKISIDSQKVLSIYYCFGINFKTEMSLLRKHINKIEKTKNMFNQPYLIIWNGRKKFEIFTDLTRSFNISTPELDWLAYELSDWLGLPITKD